MGCFYEGVSLYLFWLGEVDVEADFYELYYKSKLDINSSIIISCIKDTDMIISLHLLLIAFLEPKTWGREMISPMLNTTLPCSE